MHENKQTVGAEKEEENEEKKTEKETEDTVEKEEEDEKETDTEKETDNEETVEQKEDDGKKRPGKTRWLNSRRARIMRRRYIAHRHFSLASLASSLRGGQARGSSEGVKPPPGVTPPPARAAGSTQRKTVTSGTSSEARAMQTAGIGDINPRAPAAISTRVRKRIHVSCKFCLVDVAAGDTSKDRRCSLMPSMMLPL